MQLAREQRVSGKEDAPLAALLQHGHIAVCANDVLQVLQQAGVMGPLS